MECGGKHAPIERDRLRRGARRVETLQLARPIAARDEHLAAVRVPRLQGVRAEFRVGPEGLDRYRKEKNSKSIDGLPGLQRASAP